MTREELDLVLKHMQLKADKDGTLVLPDDSSATVYVAHDGATLSVSKVATIKAEGELLFLRTQKKEVFAIARSDVFAVAAEGAAGGQPARRPAGFTG
jgi:hypothetical protein